MLFTSQTDLARERSMSTKTDIHDGIKSMKWRRTPLTRLGPYYWNYILRDGEEKLATLSFHWLVRFNVKGTYDATSFRIVKPKRSRGLYKVVRDGDGSELASLEFFRPSPGEWKVTMIMADGATHSITYQGDKDYKHYDENEKLVAITHFRVFHGGLTVEFHQPESVRLNYEFIASVDLFTALIIISEVAIEATMAGG